jgi:hypothetical protein
MEDVPVQGTGISFSTSTGISPVQVPVSVLDPKINTVVHV